METIISRTEKLLPQYNVEGFDPNSVLTKVVEKDALGNESASLFMKYAPAMAWFLTVYPDGCFNHQFNVLNERKATVTASIYRNAQDTRPAMTATCTRYYGEDENGRYYEQNAVTAAYRKALGYLGFGTPLDAHEVEGIQTEMASSIPERTDKGVPITATPAIPAGIPGCLSEAESTKLQRKSVAKPAVNLDEVMVDSELASPKATNKDSLNQPSAVPEAKRNSVAEFAAKTSSDDAMTPAASVPAPAISVNTEKIPTTLSEAMEIVCPYGKIKGMKLRDSIESLGDSANGYIRYLYDHMRHRAPNSPFIKAAEIYCEVNGC